MDDEPREIGTEAPVLPACLARRLADGVWWRDTVGEAGCVVHRIAMPAGADLYLKHGGGALADDVLDEATRSRWLAGQVAVPRVEHLVADRTGAWLLTTALPGRTAWQVMTDTPARQEEIVVLLAHFLRRLHALPAATCPFNAGHPLRLDHARRRMEAGLVDTEDFGEAHAGWSAEQVWDAMMRHLPFDPDTVVTHGDYSLDNILIDGAAVSGCIDTGRLGTADRHQDLAILGNCLDEFDPRLRAVFLDAYGLATADRARLDFHLCLDEFF